MGRRWGGRIVVALLLAWAVFVLGFVPWWLGGVAVSRRFDRPDRENGQLTPASFDMAFDDIRFRSADGVDLEGWWVPAEANRGSAVLVHGLNRSRVEMVHRLPLLHELGWNALLFDLRRHGRSGGDTSSLGWFEREDVLAAVALARARGGDPVVLWGVSLGAASAALAAAEDPTVAGLICDSSFRSLRDTVRHHLGLFRRFRWWLKLVPGWPTADLAVFWIGRRGGFDPDAVDVEAAVRRLDGRAALFVCNSGDRRMPKEIAFDLQSAAGPGASLLVVPGDSHGGAWRDGTEAYANAVREVLEEVAPPGESVAGAAPGAVGGGADAPGRDATLGGLSR